jgi:hypothetical protein
MFYIDMEKNKTIEVIEYREGDRLCLLLNGILKYDGINPYPDKAPFVICTYEKSAGSFIGTGIGHKLLGLQKEADLVHNGIKDALTM